MLVTIECCWCAVPALEGFVARLQLGCRSQTCAGLVQCLKFEVERLLCLHGLSRNAIITGRLQTSASGTGAIRCPDNMCLNGLLYHV